MASIPAISVTAVTADSAGTTASTAATAAVVATTASGSATALASASQVADENYAARHVAAFFEKFERDHYECQELLSQATTHWLLSADEHRSSVGSQSSATNSSVSSPPGLISQMTPVKEMQALLLVPIVKEENVPGLLDMREVHQIVRELTNGIYAMNQLPSISLEPNEDSTSTCHMPPAYMDTRVGRLLTEVDAALKGLWHGVWFPRDKRTKFAERWQNAVDSSGDMPAGDKEARNQLLAEFLNAGMIDASTDPDYSQAYDELSREEYNGPVTPDIDALIEAERRFFMSHVDDIVLRLIFHQESVAQYRNLFVIDSQWSVVSAFRDVDPDTSHSYERLDQRLRLHRAALHSHLADKAVVSRQLAVLKLVAFLTTLLVAMRRRMMIPDVTRMLPNMTGDELRTERELPPLVIGENFKCPNFHYPPGAYFHMHGGILIDNETQEVVSPSEAVINAYDAVVSEATGFLGKYIDAQAPYQETYSAPVVEIDGQRYHVIAVDFETYYPQHPQSPRWVLAMHNEVLKQRPRRLPITEVQIHEQFKKYFGYKRAIKLRNLPQGLRMAAQRGLVSMFSTLCRKCPTSRLGKHDDNGMTLMHHAAVYNRPNIISILIQLGQDINVRKISTVFASGPSPLHLAVRCGSIDAVACLLAYGANTMLTDEQGWAAIHHAAYYDQERILRMLIRRNENMIEMEARNEYRSTPLLLAASSGALSTLKCLISLNASVVRNDERGNSAVHLAAMRRHTNVLGFFIEWNRAEIDVWNTLVGMMKHDDIRRKDAAVRCLEVLTTTEPSYWRPLLEAGGIPALVSMLHPDDQTAQTCPLHVLVTAVLCNVSENEAVREALTQAGAAPILVRFLDLIDIPGSTPASGGGAPSLTTSPGCFEAVDVVSRAAVVLADLADASDDNRRLIADGGVTALVRLLDSNFEDILANSVNAIRVLCSGEDVEIRTAFRVAGAIPSLVEFLSVASDILQAGSAAAIAALAFHHRENQSAVIAEGAVRPLVNLIKGHSMNAQIKAALAVEVLAYQNELSQAEFLRHDTSKALIRLLKMFSLEVKEQAALALWSLAGQTKGQQRLIAETISIPMLIEILLRDSDKLQYVGCMGMMALGREDTEGQLRVAQQGGIQPLVRLLRVSKTSPRVILAVIQALASLCIGVAFCANKVVQTRIAEENAIETLVHVLTTTTSDELKVEIAYALGCIVLCHSENLEQLQQFEAFSFDLVRDLLDSPIEEVKLKAGFALAIFAFNNMPQQYAIRQAGGLGISCFEQFLLSDNEIEKATAAFQIVVLARVIVDADSVDLTAHGITTLVNILSSSNDNAVVHAAGLLSSLAHTRAGLPDAMFAVGVMPLLIKHLDDSSSESVRHACAVTLGYLTYNRTAARYLLTACRNTVGLYDRLVSSIGVGSKINANFIDEFERARTIGLPCLSLTSNGRPTTLGQSNAKRSQTASGSRSMVTSSHPARATSAPVVTVISLPEPRVRKTGTVQFKDSSPGHGKPSSSPEHVWNGVAGEESVPNAQLVDRSGQPSPRSNGDSSSSLLVGKQTSFDVQNNVISNGSVANSRPSGSATFKTRVATWQRK